MPRARRRHRPNEVVDLAAELATLELVQVKVGLPRPVEMGLEQLVVDLMARAHELGDVTRGELLGALLLPTVREPADLPRLVETFRNAKVHEALPHVTATEGTIDVPPRAPGRPARRRR
jgi:hypothetical protein